MVSYHIIINKAVQGQYETKELMCATGKGRSRLFRFRIQKNAVEVQYEMSKAKTLDYIIEKSDVFREALTKAYLYHALLLNSSLQINIINIHIGNNEYILSSNDYASFPFVYSLLVVDDLQLLVVDDLQLSDEFKAIPEHIVTNSIKYNQKELRFVSLASYLTAKSKTYEIERFNALWTSMNALYNYIGKCYNNRILADCGNVTRKIPKNLQLYNSDVNSISAMMYHLKAGCFKPTRKDENTYKANNKQAFEKLVSTFQKLSDTEISELYELCLADLNATGLSHTLPEKYASLDRVSKLYGFPSYVFLVLQSSYALRCELFHGNKSTPIFCAYNDRSIGELRVINFFLDSFLKSEIPLLFTTDYYNNMHNDIVALMNSGSLDYDKHRCNLYDEFVN